MRAQGMREGDMRHQPAAEKGADASPGAVEELVWHHDVQRLVLLLEAANGARRKNPLDSQHLEAVDVRANV